MNFSIPAREVSLDTSWGPASLQDLCELALKWHSKGLLEEAGGLSHFLLSLESFPTLWCPHQEYNETVVLDLLSQIKKIKPIPQETLRTDLVSIKDSLFTWSGEGSSLGIIRSGEVEIRAFGPQTTEAKFGIQGIGENGWVQTFANPEIWLEMKVSSSALEYVVDLRFVGVTLDEPFLFAFYVKAKNCLVQDLLLQPKSLQRFQGEVDRVSFEKELTIATSLPKKVQVIPLAGEGCFWDCEFLVIYEIYPAVPQIRFSFLVNS